MQYRGIVNFPRDRAVLTHKSVWWGPFDGPGESYDSFTPGEADRIVEMCKTIEPEKAGTIGGMNEEVRISKIAWLKPNDETRWIFNKVNSAIDSVNNLFYGFALNGYETMQFTEYHAEEQGKYEWHMDMCMGDDCLPADMIQPRKLSLTILLNEPGVDFEGGDFQFNDGQETKPRSADLKKGRIIAFPSWMIHRVSPVTKGVRKSLVVWVTGPKFT